MKKITLITLSLVLAAPAAFGMYSNDPADSPEKNSGTPRANRVCPNRRQPGAPTKKNPRGRRRGRPVNNGQNVYRELNFDDVVE